MFLKAITKNLIFYFMFVRTVQTISMLHLPCVDLIVHSINQPYQQAAHWIVWFFLDLPSNPMPPMGHPTHPLKMIPRNQRIRKSETVFNTCVSLMKQHWKKVAEIPQNCDFLTWSIQNFVRKKKQFVGKYIIVLLINWLA